MITVDTPDLLKDAVGLEVMCPLPRAVSPDMLAAFTSISQDHSPLHQLAAPAPIIPGKLLITLLPAMLQSGLQVKHFAHCKTVALDKVRFFQSVGIEQQLQLSYRLLRVKTRGDSTFVVAELTLLETANNSKILAAEQTDCYVISPTD